MMDLQQMRHFVRVVELGSIDRAALDLQVPRPAVDDSMAALQGMVSTGLFDRLGDAVMPTEAGMAFFREVQLALRHVDQATRASQASRLTGSVSIGLTPTACSVLGLPLLQATRKRYPDLRVHVVESLSGHLASMLNTRQLDLAVLYDAHAASGWHVSPLLEERLFFVQSARHPVVAKPPLKVGLADIAAVPLILPTCTHRLRNVLDAAFSRARVTPTVVAEIDSLALLMDAVDAGLGASVQPWAATRRFADAAERFHLTEIVDRDAMRTSVLCSLSRSDMSTAAVATRVLLAVCARELVRSGAWRGASIRDH